MAVNLAQLPRAPGEPAPIGAARERGSRGREEGRPLRRLARAELFAPRRVPLAELVVFTQQLVLLLRGGSGLAPSIRALASQTRRPLMRGVLERVTDRLESGRGLSEAMPQHPEAFDTLYVSIVKGGEASGQLAASLAQLARILETKRLLRERIREALSYPTLLLTVMAVVVVFMLVYMVPRFGELFRDMGPELPWSTRLILIAASALRSSWWLLLPIGILAGVGVARLWRRPAVRHAWDRAKVRLPIVRTVFGEGYLFQLFSSLGLLLGSRVPHLEAIGIVRRSIRHVEYDRFFDELTRHVEAGRGVSPAFQEAAFLPDTVKLMVATGESAGALDRTMLDLSERYRESLESHIRRLSSLMEPVLLVVMGLMVGFLAVSFILPLFKLSRMVH